jgi:hypothetical protein
MIETTKYARKSFEVDAVQVTADNMEDVASWCGGTIEAEHEDGSGRYIRVKVTRVINDEQTKAMEGYWVLLYGANSFKVYNPKAFAKTFEKIAKVPAPSAEALTELSTE